jgi:hypothetical protein
MGIDGFQNHDAFGAAVEKIAFTGPADRNRRPREALLARYARAPEPLSSSQARRVNDRKVLHVLNLPAAVGPVTGRRSMLRCHEWVTAVAGILTVGCNADYAMIPHSKPTLS